MSDVFSAHSAEEVDCTLEGSWASLWKEQMNVGKRGLKPRALMERMYHTWKQSQVKSFHLLLLLLL